MITRTVAGFSLAVGGIALVMGGASAPSPFYPAVQAQLDISPFVMASVFAIYALTLLATLLILGSVSDHLGRRPTTSFGFTLLALGFVLFWHAGSVGLLLTARGVQV